MVKVTDYFDKEENYEEVVGSWVDTGYPHPERRWKLLYEKFNNSVEEPLVEEPIVENMPNNECGPGTILEDDICILDQRCGPGTILEDGACVLDSAPVTSSSSGNSKELIMSITVAFVIAGIIGIILALISRANRNKN